MEGTKQDRACYNRKINFYLLKNIIDFTTIQHLVHLMLWNIWEII